MIFVTMMDKAGNSAAELLLLGDFNVNMFLSQPSWESTLNMLGLQQLITSATRVTKSSSTLIDHIYTSDTSRVLKSCVLQVSLSDHYAVCCNWALKIDKCNKNQHTSIHYRSFKRFNQDLFLADLCNTDFQNVYNHINPEDALAEWYGRFLCVLDRHAPLREKRIKQAQLPRWLTKEIRDAMALRDELKRNKDFDGYRRQRNRVRYLVREAKKVSFKKMVENKSDTISIWRALNAFTRPKQTTRCIPISADTFNEHFLSASAKLLASQSNYRPCISDKLKDFCDEKLPVHCSFNIPDITVFDVGKSISQMKNKCSFGHDGISAFFLKLSLPYIVEPLTFIYNLILRHGSFPNALKKAKVVPLPKSRDLSDPNNFRPISLLPMLSKPIEKHVHRHLNMFLESNNLFYPLQSGFRNRHSCHSSLSHMANSWLTSINKSEMTGALFLDFSKAFDLVSHDLLIKKLKTYHLSADSLSFFKSYLSDRSQYVFVNGKSSTEGTLKCGVPQGSILGPLLFSIYINDLPLNISQSHVHCSLFADDTTLDVSSTKSSIITSSLQKALDDICNWCKENSMVLNPSKTECMLITTRQKLQLNPPPLSLSINSEAIKQVKEHKLLGIIVDNQLTWQAHLDYVCKKISKNLFLMSKLIPLTDPPTRRLFYAAHVQSHIDYSSTVWDGCSDNTLKRLNSLHRRAAKLILPKRSDTTEERMRDLDMLPLRKHLLYNKGVFMHKVTHSSAPQYLTDLFRPAASPYKTAERKLFVPRPRIDMFKNSISYAGAHLWNDFPAHITLAPSMSTFRARLFTHLIRN